MIAVALGAAVLAVLFALPGPRSVQRLTVHRRVPRRESRRRWYAVPVVGGLALGWLVAGPAVGAVATVLVLVAATTGHLVLSWRDRRRADREAEEVARACGVLAGLCRIGLVPSAALRSAAADHPLLAEAVGVHDLGGDVAASWRDQSTRPGRQGLLALSRAWQVSTDVGAPMADALDQVAGTLGADRAVQAVVTGELAAPRATSRLLGALPAAGLVLGLALGGDPLDFLLGHPVGQACLVGGVLLVCLGLVWVDRLATSLGGGPR